MLKLILAFWLALAVREEGEGCVEGRVGWAESVTPWTAAHCCHLISIANVLIGSSGKGSGFIVFLHIFIHLFFILLYVYVSIRSEFSEAILSLNGYLL